MPPPRRLPQRTPAPATLPRAGLGHATGAGAAEKIVGDHRRVTNWGHPERSGLATEPRSGADRPGLDAAMTSRALVTRRHPRALPERGNPKPGSPERSNGARTASGERTERNLHLQEATVVGCERAEADPDDHAAVRQAHPPTHRGPDRDVTL